MLIRLVRMSRLLNGVFARRVCRNLTVCFVVVVCFSMHTLRLMAKIFRFSYFASGPSSMS